MRKRYILENMINGVVSMRAVYKHRNDNNSKLKDLPFIFLINFNKTKLFIIENLSNLRTNLYKKLRLYDR